MFNLLRHRWIPVLRQSGIACVISPAEITESICEDPVVAVNWPRADFRIATLEFLIGLLTTAFPPEGHRQWLQSWENPPEPSVLEAAFASIAYAFNLDGDGPRFLQDFEDLVSDPEPIERLLIESPGASTIGKNTDVLVHRGRVTTLGRHAAAIALYTFQSWAPSGGAGNRTGLRGGGPLVTMVVPSPHRSLWQQVWANVPRGERPDESELPRVFPWLAPTLTSKESRVVTPENNAHPLQSWWGMPRRIRLDFASVEAPQLCDLTGTPCDVTVSSWRQRPHGANYAQWGHVHPLTPAYQLKPGAEVLSLHPQPGGIGYRHWLGLVVNDGTGLRRPAPAVALWRDDARAQDAGTATRLLAAGYDMDNMKARGFVECEMPLPTAPNAETRQRLDTLATRLVRAAEQVASLLRSAVRNALFSAGATVRLEAEPLSALRERLWAQTEAAFFAALDREAKRHVTSSEGVEEREWIERLRKLALALFDEAAPMEPDSAPLTRQGETMPRLVRARRNLMFALLGFGKDGEALFNALALPAAQPKTARKGKAA
jgi:CRISPR system Cascade subunit CasA